MTHDEKQSILNAINSMQRIGLFCEICRNATCICKIGYDSSITNALDDFNMNFLTPKKNTMTPQEKAKQLVDKFSNECLLKTEGGKVAALIAVDELIKSVPYFDNMHFFDEGAGEYWVEVKQEIEKL